MLCSSPESFLAAGTSFMEDNFSMDWGRGPASRWFQHVTFTVHFVSIIVTTGPPQIIRRETPEVGDPRFRVVWELWLCIQICVCVCVCVCAKSLKSCLMLCHPMDHSPPGSSVHGILQARILVWAAKLLFLITQIKVLQLSVIWSVQ